MIIIKLKGGLGNQLFQYATARALSERQNTGLLIDNSHYIKSNKKSTERSYELSHYNINFPSTLGTNEKNYSVRANLTSLLKKIFFLVNRNFKLNEKNRDFDKEIYFCNKSCYLEGYFQSHLYFEDCRKQLLADLTIKDNTPLEIEEILKIIKSSNSLAIHVRRGDYVSNPHANQVHGTLPINYYVNGYNFIKEKCKDITSFIFSDDIDWCKKNLTFDDNAIYVEHKQTLPHWDIMLMSKCNYHIIANSSFSWWGAWLSNYGYETVVYPKRWFATEKACIESRFPKEWKSF